VSDLSLPRKGAARGANPVSAARRGREAAEAHRAAEAARPAVLESSVLVPPGGRSGSSESMNVTVYKDSLLKKKAELEQTAGLRPLQNSMEHNNGRQGDMADQAAGNNEVHIQLRLKQTDAKILQAIDEALMRIEKGTFGICRDCGEPIAEARLNAIPWTRVCISCKEKQKA
jgi:DnaK suppressor protein